MKNSRTISWSAPRHLVCRTAPLASSARRRPGMAHRGGVFRGACDAPHGPKPGQGDRAAP